jgi:hypothetical protein
MLFYSIFGKEFAQNLIEVDYENFLLREADLLPRLSIIKTIKTIRIFL